MRNLGNVPVVVSTCDDGLVPLSGASTGQVVSSEDDQSYPGGAQRTEDACDTRCSLRSSPWRIRPGIRVKPLSMHLKIVRAPEQGSTSQRAPFPSSDLVSSQAPFPGVTPSPWACLSFSAVVASSSLSGGRWFPLPSFPRRAPASVSQADSPVSPHSTAGWRACVELCSDVLS
ncbi:hypothetical protein P7K49_004397 [Saguinus oedipus]|uniref:Uncharacterized protein n=1 Tax=Saguinus oedipus TaxID=9490 RepID=A0ABQ9W799_SAGOE|nr:hypothetical protein P7K49_004397 [Saguinus oedipus]